MVIGVAHEKLKSVAVCITIFAIVGSVSWALVSAQTAHQHQIKPQQITKTTPQKLSADINQAIVGNERDMPESTVSFSAISLKLL